MRVSYRASRSYGRLQHQELTGFQPTAVLRFDFERATKELEGAVAAQLRLAGPHRHIRCHVVSHRVGALVVASVGTGVEQARKAQQHKDAHDKGKPPAGGWLGLLGLDLRGGGG